MKIAIITTVNHNVGDDFVREGILYLLSRHLRSSFSSALIHKHIPITVRDNFEWLYYGGITRYLDGLHKNLGLKLTSLLDKLPLTPTKDKVISSDLLVQSGAPVYWSLPNGGGSHQTEWFDPLIRRRYLKIRDRVPFINIGAGSCQPYDSDGSEFLANAECCAYIRELHASCALTTVRDRLAKSILNRLQLDAPVIPCPSIFARARMNILTDEPEYLAVNYMPDGGHYDFSQIIDSQRWEKTFLAFYEQVSKKIPVVVVCHDRKELAVASKLFPGNRIFVAKNAREYLKFYSRAKFYVGCRVHAAFACASFGRPAFVIGSDTRAKMVSEIGLRSIFVNEATLEVLLMALDELETGRKAYSDQFEDIKQKASVAYRDALSSVLK